MRNCSLENIELRSEKVRSIIGNIPVSLLRYEIIIILSLVLFLIVLLFYMPYNESFSIKLALSNKIQKLNHPTASSGSIRTEGTGSEFSKLKFNAYVTKDIVMRIAVGQKVEIDAINCSYRIDFKAIISQISRYPEGDIYKIEMESDNFVVFNENVFYNSDFEGIILLSDQSLYKSFLLSSKLKKY